MARSDIITWLPLDDFARIIGLSPLAFNQLSSSLNHNNVCGDIFFQQDWQHSDRIGRDTIAQAISEAEQAMAREAGFNLMPDWTIAERLPYPKPSVPEAYGMGVNVRWQMKSVEALKGYVHYGGIRAKSLIQAGATFTRSDLDTDGYAETCTLTIPTSVTDANEIHLYYPAQNGDDAWEIRPIKVSFSGGNVTITFKAWQIAAANQMDNIDPQPLDADSAASYETTVDVYRVYNDSSQQVEFLWESRPEFCTCGGSGTCTACQLGTQGGCFTVRDQRLGFIVPSPATYSDGYTEVDWALYREPDQVRLWYVSGYVDYKLARPFAEISEYWKRAIAYYACSMFERPVCGCSNVNSFIEKWRRDSAFSSQEEGGFTATAEIAANRLGTSMGALYAWKTINRNGVRVIK